MKRMFMLIVILSGLLLITACGLLLPPGGAVTKTYPYEIAIKMDVDGNPITIDRGGTCSYHVDSMMHASGSSSGVSYWKSDLSSGSVATVLPNGSAVIVELPSPCSGSGSVSGSDTSSPLSNLPTAYVPVTIWIRDIRNFDGFELYPSIGGNIPAAVHVHVVNVVIRKPASNAELQQPTAEELTLANRFGWNTFPNTSPDQTEFMANAAYVLPKSFWSKDKILNEFFSAQTHLVVVDSNDPDPASQEIIRRYVVLLNLTPSGVEWGMPPLSIGQFNEQFTNFYEIPVVKNGNDWVLDRDLKGVRFYNDVGTSGKSINALTYKGIKLTRGILYDPETQELVGQGLFRIYR